jgi:predicted methyltransferase
VHIEHLAMMAWQDAGFPSGYAVTPLLTAKIAAQLKGARDSGAAYVDCSLDLQRSVTTVGLDEAGWNFQGQRFPYPASLKDRAIYHWVGGAFEPIARYASSLIKLVPTDWGPPTFEIDGIKMLPTARVSPYADAEHKVDLIRPRGKVIVDTCGGLGYFAACCLAGGAERVLSYEINPDVIWLRSLNPWSPVEDPRLTLTHGDVVRALIALPDASADAVLHDPPRFGIAGELYAKSFYDQLARVLKRRGRLFHYTGIPNKLTSGRDLPNEVAKRLLASGFTVEKVGDGILAVKR